MTVESADDLAVFFNEDEFAVAATYLPAQGVAAAVTVILDRPDADAALGRLGITAHAPTAQIRLDEVPAGSPAPGDHIEVTIEGRRVTFAVVDGSAEITGRVMRLKLNEVDA